MRARLVAAKRELPHNVRGAKIVNGQQDTTLGLHEDLQTYSRASRTDTPVTMPSRERLVKRYFFSGPTTENAAP